MHTVGYEGSQLPPCRGIGVAVNRGVEVGPTGVDVLAASDVAWAVAVKVAETPLLVSNPPQVPHNPTPFACTKAWAS
jgi:hypothetical protein